MPQSPLVAQNNRYVATVFGPTALAAVGDFPQAAEYQHVVVVISGLATETISVTSAVNLDSAALSFTAALRPFDLATGAVAAASTLGNGSYIFRDYGGGLLRFTKSAGADTVTIRIFAKTVGVQ